MDFNISRFLIKQNALDLDESPPYSNYERALNEIKNGRKTSHWIWYIFPQGPFGISETSKHFSISSIDEGLAYLSNFILEERLRKITQSILTHKHKDINEILGSDRQKFHACMTLFSNIDSNHNNEFKECLISFFQGREHKPTIDYFKFNEHQANKL
jgi:uncharacterized protein (DUF1810 family)